MMKLPLSIGILAWHSELTLLNTLTSYKNNGLFDLVEDVTIFFQEITEQDKKLAEQFNIQYIGSDANVGIGGGFYRLAENAKCENILLLEHDWELIENYQVTQQRLSAAISMLDRCSVVRLRHRTNPGYPLYVEQAYKGKELEHYEPNTKLISPHLIETAHWIPDLDQRFPDKIKLIDDHFVTTCRWSCWTNNPCIYKKDFYISIVSGFYDKHIHLEPAISYWWSRQPFSVASSHGLFTHNDLQKHGFTRTTEPVIENVTKKENNHTIAFICAHRISDIWTTPISVMNEFRERGWEVKIYSLFDEHDNYVDDNIPELLNTNPDIIIHMDWGRHQSSILSKLKDTKAFCIMESGDDPQQYERNSVKAPWFDIILSNDYQSVEKYRTNGHDAYWWPPFADYKLYQPLDIEEQYTAVSSRGMNNGSWLLDHLATLFKDNVINQNGWIAEKHTEFLNSGKIVLQHSRHGELTRRIFEAMACKKLVLTDKLDKSTKADTIFEDGKDLVYYNSLEDCIDKIIYYANHNQERLEIAESGYQKVLSGHTQIQRVDFIIEQWKKFKNKQNESN